MRDLLHLSPLIRQAVYPWLKRGLSAALYAVDAAFALTHRSIPHRSTPQVPPSHLSPSLPVQEPFAQTLPAPHVLIVRTDRLGDFLLWLPAACRLCSELIARGYRVTVLLNQDAADFAQALPDAVCRWPVSLPRLWTSPAYRWQIARRLRDDGYDWAINAVYPRYPPTSDALIRLSRARRRSGWNAVGTGCTLLGHWFGNTAYSELVSPPLTSLHEYQSNEALLSALGIPLSAEPVVLPQADSLPSALSERLSLSNGTGSHASPAGYYLLALGCSMPLRRWPMARFAELAERLFHRFGLLGVLCGSGEDQVLAEQVMAQTTAPLLSLCGQISLPQLVTVLRQARGLCGNDSMAVHLAATVGCPSVCLSGGGMGDRFFPYRSGVVFTPPTPPVIVDAQLSCRGCGWDCCYPSSQQNPAPCVERIAVEAVFDALCQSLRPSPWP